MNDTSSPTPTRNRGRPPPSERRTRALDAFIDLVLERGDQPRPDEVAERADVSIASLYRYFTDLDELRHDAVARLAERFPHLFVISGIGTGERRQRITAFAAARTALHETLHPLELLARATSRRDPAVRAQVDAVRVAMADQVSRHFDIELRTLGPARRDDTVATIAALTSVESWEQFRHSLGRTPAQTRRAWSDAIDRILPTTDPTSER